MFVAGRGASFRAYVHCQRPTLDLGLLSKQTGYIGRVETLGSDMLTRNHPRERFDTISGRVRNARPKQQIVIYAHSGPSWVQPWPPYLGS
jgi:hypothetical protein